MNSSEAWNFCSKLKVIYTLWKVLKNWWTRRQIILNMLQKKQWSMKNLWFSHLLHSISSGQATPNSSMSFKHSLWARWQNLWQGGVTRLYSTQIGAQSAQGDGRKPREQSKFTTGRNGQEKVQIRSLDGQLYTCQSFLHI